MTNSTKRRSRFSFEPRSHEAVLGLRMDTACVPAFYLELTRGRGKGGTSLKRAGPESREPLRALRGLYVQNTVNPFYFCSSWQRDDERSEQSC